MMVVAARLCRRQGEVEDGAATGVVGTTERAARFAHDAGRDARPGPGRRAPLVVKKGSNRAHRPSRQPWPMVAHLHMHPIQQLTATRRARRAHPPWHPARCRSRLTSTCSRRLPSHQATGSVSATRTSTFCTGLLNA